ncbi:MAG: hypothetical protein MZV64_13200 [Ignavibacteriales bacterium]|nr:hypothetical protein [Ignavibacteriales bacterium]
MSLFKRLPGVFFEPRPTFEGLAARPVWIDALVVVLLALIAFNLVIAPILQKDQLSLLKDNAALKERMGEDSYAKMIDRTEHPSPAGRIMQTFVITPLYLPRRPSCSRACSCSSWAASSRPRGPTSRSWPPWSTPTSSTSCSGNAVRLVLGLTRGSLMQTSTGLALLFPNLEVTSTPYIVLAQVDLFQLWMFGVLAFGLAAIFKISAKKALILSYGLWFLKALVNIGMGLIGTAFLTVN